ncbi:MAG: zinc-binding dehydrogenase [Aggregatilineales bacterium]
MALAPEALRAALPMPTRFAPLIHWLLRGHMIPRHNPHKLDNAYRTRGIKLMRAILLPEHGSADKLVYTVSHPIPTPGPGEVRIRVYAAALNRLDIWVRNGWPGLKLPMPHIPGADAAGKIDALGAGVDGWTVGDRVVINPSFSCGRCEFCRAGHENLCASGGILGEEASGTFAEYIVVSARNLLKIPDTVDYGDAAAAALVYLTAWHSLITKAAVRPGQSVLIVGASGGVNSASIQIAKLAGATVYVVGSNAAKLEEARQLGADSLIDRSQTDWPKAVYTLTEKHGVDIVIDNVGKDTMPGSLRAAKRGGKILIVGNTSGPQAQIDLRYIFSKHLTIIGSTMAPYSDFAAVMGLVFAGKLKPIISARLPLERAAEAERMLESGDVFGKIVLEIPD